jgi:hypothetical protein
VLKATDQTEHIFDNRYNPHFSRKIYLGYKKNRKIIKISKLQQNSVFVVKNTLFG